MQTSSHNTAQTGGKHTPAIASTSAAPVWAHLSFVKVKRQRGYYVCSDWLAVPAETYGAGRVTGYRAMAELLALAHANPDHAAAMVQNVMEAAILECTKPFTTGMPSKRGAASAIMASMVQLVMSANSFNPAEVRRWLQGQVEHSLHINALLAHEEAQATADWVQRMKAAKAAKKARAGLEAGHECPNTL